MITGRYGRMCMPYSARWEIGAAPNFKVLRYFNLLECEFSIYRTFREIRSVTDGWNGKGWSRTVRDGRELQGNGVVTIS